MDNKEIIVIEDCRIEKSSVIVEFVTPDNNMPYNDMVVNGSARKFADALYEHMTLAFCTALAKELRDRRFR